MLGEHTQKTVEKYFNTAYEALGAVMAIVYSKTLIIRVTVLQGSG